MAQESSLIRTVTVALAFAAMVAASPAAAQQRAENQQRPQTSGPQKADLNDVVRHPDNYIGKTISVEGEVVDVIGPHLFIVDTPKWFHLWGGMLVVVPEPFAAMVRRDAPVRVSGTVEKVVLAEAKRKWSFLNDPKIEVDLFEKPVIVATELTTVAPTVVNLKLQVGQPVGTSGSNAAAPITDLAQVSRANDSALVGRRVDLSGIVARMEGDGFWLKTPSGAEIFVLPATKSAVRASQNVTVHGTVLETPRRTNAQKNDKTTRHPIYVYTDQVAPK